MRFPRVIASAVLATGMLVGPPAALAADPPQPAPVDPAVAPVAPEPAANRPPTDPNDPLSAIRNAPDPSAAVEAYARARTGNADPVALEQAYVGRLVALGLPELAEAQARDLTHRRPDDGVAWAVVAYMDARRGDTSTAMADIVTAAHLAPDDPFVLRTTGQVAAYYDRNADRVDVAAGVKTAFEDVRKAAAVKDAYVRAYREASDAYAQNPDSGRAPSVAPYPTPAPSNAYYDSYYNGGYYGGYAYPDPYCYGYAYPGYAYWPSTWWWGSSVVFFADFHHHHDDHHDGHHDGHHDDHHDGHHDGDHSHGSSFDHNHSASAFRGNSASSFHGNSASSFRGNASSFARTSAGSGFRGVQRGFNSGLSAGRGFAGSPSFARSTPASRLGVGRPSMGGGGLAFRGSGMSGGGRSFGGGGGGMHAGGGGGMHGGGGGGGHR